MGAPYLGEFVICNGMPRSASTWSFNAALGLLRVVASEPRRTVFGGYDENVERFVHDIPDGVESAVLKCHTLDAFGRDLARSGRASVIYTYRDPADAIVSCMEMWGQDFETAFESVRWSLDVFSFHRSIGRALVVDYETIVGSPVAAVGLIRSYLDIRIEDTVVRRVAEETALGRMKAKAEALKAADLVRVGGVDHDPETLLHPSHVRDGRSGKGRELLTSEQLDRVSELLTNVPAGPDLSRKRCSP